MNKGEVWFVEFPFDERDSRILITLVMSNSRNVYKILGRK